MPYELEASVEFEKSARKRCAKNAGLARALERKITQVRQILETNPGHFKPLSGPLAGLRRVHVADSFVLLFEV
ncbi:MAG: type II toxin-antitoxin system RelE/ParE family toxin [Candidatus Micrarchaeota archaeon]|nr:type II toxin-antitoxin system RelE/ParE family toxin [Candidatus Micrarchaeota archaeon]